jgi:perosamine synthetase
MDVIKHNKPCLGEEEKLAVWNVLSSGWIAQGPEAEGLESDFVSFLGGGGAVALSSGTSSLYLALKVLGVGRGDEVILPTYVCSALLNAIFMAEARPVVADIRDSDFNIDPGEVEKALTDKTKAIIVPHTYGFSADIPAIREFGLPVIEDAAQAPGGFRGQFRIGTLGAIAVFSFYATKLITGGQGGLLFSRNEGLIEKARDYREFDCRKEYYPRFNFKMTDIQAALARCQFKRLEQFINRRKEIADRYLEAISSTAGFQTPDPGVEPVYYRFVLLLGSAERRDRLRAYLHSNGVETIVPVERYELLHNYLNLDPSRFPVSERIVDVTLSLPLYPALTGEEITKICRLLETAPL